MKITPKIAQEIAEQITELYKLQYTPVTTIQVMNVSEGKDITWSHPVINAIRSALIVRGVSVGSA